MKKILFAVALLAAFTAQAFAGPNFGVNISYQSETMMGDDAEYFADETASSGFGVGFNMLFPFSNMVALHSGVVYQLNAYSYTVGGVDCSMLFMNFQIPVLARINFTPGLFAEAGLDMQLNFFAQGYDEVTDEWNDIENWSTFQLSPTIGMGYTMWFGLEFAGRFSYGLLDPFSKGDADLSPLRFQIDISYWFGYKR